MFVFIPLITKYFRISPEYVLKSAGQTEVGTPRTMRRTPPPLIRNSLVQTTPGQCVYFPLSLPINVRMDLFGLWKGLYPPPMRNIMMQQLKVIKGNISLNIMYFPKVVQKPNYRRAQILHKLWGRFIWGVKGVMDVSCIAFQGVTTEDCFYCVFTCV